MVHKPEGVVGIILAERKSTHLEVRKSMHDSGGGVVVFGFITTLTDTKCLK